MNNSFRTALGLTLIMFGALVLFANLSIYNSWFEYNAIMRIVGLTMSTFMSGVFIYWIKNNPDVETTEGN